MGRGGVGGVQRGEHQAAWALRAVFIQGGFFFNPKVKAFLFETSIYIPESKKKKKKKQGSRAPGLYLSPVASQTQHQSCARGTFLALSQRR